MGKEQIAGYYTLQRETRRLNLPLDRIDTGIHEGYHVLTAHGLGVGVEYADSRPQGGPVLGITKTVHASPAKHMAIAMASSGLGGTAGDEGNASFINYITHGSITREYGIAVKNAVLGGYTSEERQVFGEMLAQRGKIIGSQVSGIIFDVRAEIRGIDQEKRMQKYIDQEPNLIIFDAKRGDPQDLSLAA